MEWDADGSAPQALRRTTPYCQPVRLGTWPGTDGRSSGSRSGTGPGETPGRGKQPGPAGGCDAHRTG